MTPHEEYCVARVYNAALGIIDRKTITKYEIDITIEILKKYADDRKDWTEDKKEAYKLLADYAKEQAKNFYPKKLLFRLLPYNCSRKSSFGLSEISYQCYFSL